MKPTRTRESAAVSKAEADLYRSLLNERAKIIARLRELENREIATYMPSVFAEVLHACAQGGMIRD
jgi:hypothetical protein